MQAQNSLSSSLGSFVSHHEDANKCRQHQDFKEARHVLRLGADELLYNLTEKTLAGSDMISENPYVFTNDDTGSLIAFYHLGSKLAGHAKIVHGGMAAVLLDECMGRACFPRLAGKIAVTAKLDLNYKSPILIDSIIVIRAETSEVQGRKAWVEARIEDAREGTTLVEAKGLFIEPKWSGDMSKVM